MDLFSSAGITAWQQRLDASPRFRAAAGSWHGRLLLIERGEADIRSTWIVVGDGRCTEARVGRDGDDAVADYVLAASPATWHELTAARTTPTAAALRGDLSLLKGSVFALLPHAGAAAELLAAAAEGKDIMSDVTLDVADNTTMRAFVARPEDIASHTAPGLILFQEAFGVNAHIRDVAARFAGQGYVVIAPEMFHRTADPGYVADYTDFDSVRPHISALTPDGIMADARAAHEWLLRDTAVDAKRIAAIGYCMGGRCAYLANAALPLRAAVSYYGGGMAAEHARDLHAPHLFFWGGQDTHIPQAQRQGVIDALIEAKKSYVNVVMGDAGHAFFCDQRPAYEPDSAAESWAMTLEFLGRKNN